MLQQSLESLTKIDFTIRHYIFDKIINVKDSFKCLTCPTLGPLYVNPKINSVDLYETTQNFEERNNEMPKLNPTKLYIFTYMY